MRTLIASIFGLICLTTGLVTYLVTGQSGAAPAVAVAAAPAPVTAAPEPKLAEPVVVREERFLHASATIDNTVTSRSLGRPEPSASTPRIIRRKSKRSAAPRRAAKRRVARNDNPRRTRKRRPQYIYVPPF